MGVPGRALKRTILPCPAAGRKPRTGYSARPHGTYCLTSRGGGAPARGAKAGSRYGFFCS